MPQLLAVTVVPIPPPSVEWRAVAPELALAAGGLVTLLWVAFFPGRRSPALLWLTLADLAVAAGLVAWTWDLRTSAFEGAFVVDGLTRYARVILIAVGFVTALMASTALKAERDEPLEVFPMLLLALTGMSALAGASDLLVVFIALELLSLSLYIMAGATRRLGAQEAAMKYFLLGAFSSAFLLYGIALCYGSTGTTSLLGIAQATVNPALDTPLLLAGVGLLAVGFCFKVAAVPFHMWTPDVYQGAPTPVTAFMAAGTKAAGFAVFLRVFVGALGGLRLDWMPAIAAISVLTMLAGAIIAVVQSDIKRMLAYSSIAHAGYLLIGIAAGSQTAISASMFYLLTYALTVMGAFAVVQYATHADGTERASVEDYRGFGRRHPALAGLLALFLFSLAGIPPLAGFWGKLFIFQAGIDAGLGWLVVIGVVSSVIAAFFYLRVVVVMFMQEPVGVSEPAPERSSALWVALALAGLATVLIGLAPEALVNAAQAAGQLLG